MVTKNELTTYFNTGFLWIPSILARKCKEHPVTHPLRLLTHKRIAEPGPNKTLPPAAPWKPRDLLRFSWRVQGTSLWFFRGAKFTKNKNDQWSSAARVSLSKRANPWYMTYSVLPFTIREPRQVCLNCAGLWLCILNTTGWPPVVFQGLAPMDQLSKSRTKTNLQAKYRTPRMPLAARRWFSEGSKSRSQKTSQCVQVMFKAKNHIYKKHGFSKFDHTTMRKKTRQNELDGWKHDGWALASGYASIILDFVGNMGESIVPVFPEST